MRTKQIALAAGLSLLVSMMPRTAAAQSATTGSIGGVVRDATGCREGGGLTRG